MEKKMQYFLKCQILRPQAGSDAAAKMTRTAKFDRPFLIIFSDSAEKYAGYTDVGLKACLFAQACKHLPPLDTVDFQDFFSTPQNCEDYADAGDPATVILYLEKL